MKLVVGLGNPGEKYQNNRHNIGFMIVDGLLNFYKLGSFKQRPGYEYNKCEIDGEKAVIIKPQNYMNLSGIATVAAANFYKVDSILIIHDDIDLPLGRVKCKIGGGHGGHNGLRSIDGHLGTNNYARLRVGVGRPMNNNMVSDFVLGNFSTVEQDIVGELTLKIAKIFGLLLKDSWELFMTRMAQK